MNYELDKKEFVRRLKEFRAENNLSQQSMSLESGLDRMSVYSWENMKHTPSLQAIVPVCKRYGISLDWLCDIEVKE